jgi:two-component system, OmpR family, heavy metal sensor histidine kinase CusS
MSEAISTQDHNALPRLGHGREQALAVTAAIRLAAGVAFLGIGSALTYEHKIGAWPLMVPLMVYLALSAIAFAFRKRALFLRLSWVMPFIDIGMTALVYYQGIAAEQSFHTVVASWGISSIGVFTLIVALVGLSMPVRWVIFFTILSAEVEGALLTTVGLTFWAVLVVVFALGFVAVATSAVPRTAKVALQSKEQAATAIASLAKMQEKNHQLELLQREKDALLEIIVHDMRSPIGATLLSLEYLGMELKKHPSQAPLLEATDDALSTLNSLSSMISQLLDTSKLESGRITLRLDITLLRPILEATAREASSRAHARSITVSFEAPENLKAAVDMRLFPLALNVLTTYSLRHTPEGGRLLMVASGEAEEVRVSIHSTAPAIPNAERSHIFDKFPIMTTNELRRTSPGGIGLYFSRLVAEAHQGTITVDDIDGWTMSFVIHLPSQTNSA